MDGWLRTNQATSTRTGREATARCAGTVPTTQLRRSMPNADPAHTRTRRTQSTSPQPNTPPSLFLFLFFVIFHHFSTGDAAVPGWYLWCAGTSRVRTSVRIFVCTHTQTHTHRYTRTHTEIGNQRIRNVVSCEREDLRSCATELDSCWVCRNLARWKSCRTRPGVVACSSMGSIQGLVMLFCYPSIILLRPRLTYRSDEIEIICRYTPRVGVLACWRLACGRGPCARTRSLARYYNAANPTRCV